MGKTRTISVDDGLIAVIVYLLKEDRKDEGRIRVFCVTIVFRSEMGYKYPFCKLITLQNRVFKNFPPIFL